MLRAQAIRDAVLNDLHDLVENIKEPRERVYLKDTCVGALERLGHDKALAEQVAGEFFQRTLQ